MIRNKLPFFFLSMRTVFSPSPKPLEILYIFVQLTLQHRISYCQCDFDSKTFWGISWQVMINSKKEGLFQDL